MERDTVFKRLDDAYEKWDMPGVVNEITKLFGVTHYANWMYGQWLRERLKKWSMEEND